MTPIIDTHFHIWDGDLFTLPTLDLFKGQLKRKYSYYDYQEAIKGLPIAQSLYMEVDAIKKQHQQEAEMIIALCNNPRNSIAGATVGGNLSSQKFKDYILPLAAFKAVKAVRHNLFAADPSVMKSAVFHENIHLLSELGLLFNLVMPAYRIMDGVALAKACPKTTFIIDHCGLCPILASDPEKKDWQHGIAAYASLPNTICKVSECGFTRPNYRWQTEDVQEIIHHCLASFGEDRVIYGTNWPVAEITGSIHRWLEALQIGLENFPEGYAKKLFFENAKRLFQLEL